MKTRPVIGITCDWVETGDVSQVRLNTGYIKATEAAGGIPVVLPPNREIETIAEFIDALLIPGGDDIDPCYYGEDRHEKLQLIAYQRFEFEQALLKHFDSLSKPVLGICYGCQLLNVIRGGSLYQHIPDLETTVIHKRASLQEDHPRHFVQLRTGSELLEITGLEQFEITTIHHQSIREPGEGLQIAAHAADGIVEAVEDPNKPFVIGVQWHPERDLESQSTQRLFEAFVEAALEGSIR
jgi:putative glutamine amidotransferase